MWNFLRLIFEEFITWFRTSPEKWVDLIFLHDFIWLKEENCWNLRLHFRVSRRMILSRICRGWSWCWWDWLCIIATITITINIIFVFTLLLFAQLLLILISSFFITLMPFTAIFLILWLWLSLLISLIYVRG